MWLATTVFGSGGENQIKSTADENANKQEEARTHTRKQTAIVDALYTAIWNNCELKDLNRKPGFFQRALTWKKTDQEMEKQQDSSTETGDKERSLPVPVLVEIEQIPLLVKDTDLEHKQEHLFFVKRRYKLIFLHSKIISSSVAPF